jgi:signal transduction histidine kinase
MTADQIQHVFEPFFTTKIKNGTGLGLAIVKEAIDAHHGTIQVESKVNEGSEFIVRLAVGKTPAPIEATPAN